ncbi:poly-beta-1,6-N-acetyl-D-glucosamine N-deacetylase PgaB [Serratia ficaria]|uniref:Poly-beta-1,6-N-acetyl-D-glucosamine N-deacetylase n=1 Tax=Serratia ficaria TaxID=61651 RepID=A0A240C9N6_SERFI|nr:MULTISPECIES: poly-beta-1,6-N-acetyl-D-glucosamine N-deacetylase PgaB [Serratia]MEE4485488.1 poly-beta-1,6-N-acetyl-D-glucosamine N-deacetylase PgaB [Serratia ficaria]REF43719.1 biofilm PGA synthesis lipoprotein PgaB [Serratia ficaria]CAI0698174.1 Poly-beta-1,6-N-acetyl-D-glucosamine N-deacetylase precursor [Serratia ficaria]CAI0719268.1 Poly-beta-1,6-N-acetyl-D-glucosamine N-deacetylase precursor [Serratia ficaria]CAI0728547.1 Poly-beta-1,6-N-acetyl-D-glucosamine N-deacetylase precursor [S
MLFRSSLLMLAALLTNACSQADVPRFTPPAERPVAAADRPWPANGYAVLAYHDVEDGAADQRYMAVRTSALNEQFAWLKQNGYRPVSVDQILRAQNGGPALPDKAVLLTFDDGYSSFYHRVFPLLKAYNWPAVLAPVGVWLDAPADKPVDFGGLMTPRDRFLTWQQVREVSASGLVEIGAHTYASHYGGIANPQGNTEPAVANRLYDGKAGRYESEAEYRRRIGKDVELITRRITAATGKAPRVWVWPYGAAGGVALDIVRQRGYRLALTLENGLGDVNRPDNVPRLLIAGNPSLASFAQQVTQIQNRQIMRVAHVDLDYLYDPDPQQQAKNLDKLIQRIYDLRINTVFLQAFADPKGDGNVRELYFPNRWLPMKADLFNRVSWQLSSRAGVSVYAWMPVLAFELGPEVPRVQRIDPQSGALSVDGKQYRRLSPFNPVARQRIAQIYEDLAAHATFKGILFHDDALLSDFEDAGPDALAAYRAAGFADSVQAIRQDPQMLARWTRFKSRALIDFTQTLAERVRAIRGPQVQTARNIYAMPILDPASEAWFAQNLTDFLQAYDWVAPMAMPLMENVPQDESARWLDRLVGGVAAYPGALDKTVFELQAVDWRRGRQNSLDDGRQLAEWMRRLQRNGAQSFGYYPDNFLDDRPKLDAVRPVLSSAWFPLP